MPEMHQLQIINQILEKMRS